MAILGLGNSSKKDSKSKKESKESKNKTETSTQDEAKALLEKMEMKEGGDCPVC